MKKYERMVCFKASYLCEKLSKKQEIKLKRLTKVIEEAEQVVGHELFALAREDVNAVKHYEHRRLALLKQKQEQELMQYHAGSRYKVNGHRLIPYASASLRLIRQLCDGGVI
jgi:hypothetical protein